MCVCACVYLFYVQSAVWYVVSSRTMPRQYARLRSVAVQSSICHRRGVVTLIGSDIIAYTNHPLSSVGTLRPGAQSQLQIASSQLASIDLRMLLTPNGCLSGDTMANCLPKLLYRFTPELLGFICNTERNFDMENDIIYGQMKKKATNSIYFYKNNIYIKDM